MKGDKIALYVLGALNTIGFFSVIGILIFKGIPETNSELLYILIGALITAYISSVTYFFGSSAGSAEKSKTIETIAKANNGG